MRHAATKALAALLLAAAGILGAGTGAAANSEDPGWGAPVVDVTPTPTATMNDPGWG